MCVCGRHRKGKEDPSGDSAAWLFAPLGLRCVRELVTQPLQRLKDVHGYEKHQEVIPLIP